MDNPVVRANNELSILYSEQLALAIAEAYAEGVSLAKISRMPGMPNYNTLMKWVRDRSELRIMIDGARKARAMQYEEEILEIAARADSFLKDEVPGQRLKFDALAWAAEKNDGERYGRKTTISGDTSNPVTFIVKSGFPDPTPEQEPAKIDAAGMIIEAEGKEVGSD